MTEKLDRTIEMQGDTTVGIKDDQSASMIEQNKTFMANNKKLRQLVKKLEEELSICGKEKAELENANDLLKTQVLTLERHIKDLEENMDRKLDEEKKLQETVTEEKKALEEDLHHLNEKLSTGIEAEIESILSSGQYLDTQGKKYNIVEDGIELKHDEELNALQDEVSKLQGEKDLLEEALKNTEVQKNTLSEKLNNLNDEKAEVEKSIDKLYKEKEQIETELRLDNQKLKSEIVSMLREIDEKLAVKVSERNAIDKEKESLAGELTNLVETKKNLEMDISIMEDVIGKQVIKIDDLSTKCCFTKELESDLLYKTKLIKSLCEDNEFLHNEVKAKDEQIEETTRKCELCVTLVEEQVQAYDALKKKYEDQQRFVNCISGALDRETRNKKKMNNRILNVLGKLENKTSDSKPSQINPPSYSTSRYSKNDLSHHCLYAENSDNNELDTKGSIRSSEEHRRSILALLDEEQENRNKLVEQLRKRDQAAQRFGRVSCTNNLTSENIESDNGRRQFRTKRIPPTPRPLTPSRDRKRSMTLSKVCNGAASSRPLTPSRVSNGSTSSRPVTPSKVGKRSASSLLEEPSKVGNGIASSRPATPSGVCVTSGHLAPTISYHPDDDDNDVNDIVEAVNELYNSRLRKKSLSY